MTQTFPNIPDLVGSSIFAVVSVLTDSGEKECVSVMVWSTVALLGHLTTLSLVFKTRCCFKSSDVIQLPEVDDLPLQFICACVLGMTLNPKLILLVKRVHCTDDSSCHVRCKLDHQEQLGFRVLPKDTLTRKTTKPKIDLVTGLDGCSTPELQLPLCLLRVGLMAKKLYLNNQS